MRHPHLEVSASAPCGSAAHRATTIIWTALLAVVLAVLSAAAIVTPVQSSPAEAASSGKRLIEWNPTNKGRVFLKNVRDRNRKLPGAPRSFRDKIHRELRSIWQRELDGAPECKQVAGIQVRSLRTDGYALGNVVSKVGDTGCAAGASGAVVFWTRQQGSWKRAIESADIVECAELELIKFPSELGIDQCFDGTEVVDYHQD